MKFRVIILIAALMLVGACSKKSAPPLPFEKSSQEYEFYSSVADSIPVLSPDKQTELISTKEFSIYSGQVLPFIYPRLKATFDRSKGKLNPTAAEGMVHSAATYMAEKQLLVNEAKAKGIQVSQDSVQAEINGIYEKNGGEEKFLNMIQERGLTKDYFTKDVEESMYIRKYLNDVLYPTVDPTEEDLRNEYDKDKLATVRHILLRTSGMNDEQKAEVRKKMEDILKRARAGEDFAELAKQYTEDPGSKETGGLYADFPRGRMVKAFEDAAFSLPVGEISDIVETNYGYHIIKVIERKKEDRPFDAVKEDLKKKMVGEGRKNAEQELLDRLKSENNYTEKFSS